MMKTVDAFLSIQSPYCYFVMPRLMRLAAHPDLQVRFRQVRPGVLRIPDVFADRSELEQRYFFTDVARTAAFLGLPYAEADPSPVAFTPGSLWIAENDQPRAWRLIDLLMAAERSGNGLVLYDRVMKLIWDGQTTGWDQGGHLARAVADAGLDLHALELLATEERKALRQSLYANDAAIFKAGHWGVPCLAFEGEAFYGQDRFDQLLWRLGLSIDALPAAAV